MPDQPDPAAARKEQLLLLSMLGCVETRREAGIPPNQPLTFRQISEYTGIPISTLERTLQSGIRKLQAKARSSGLSAD